MVTYVPAEPGLGVVQGAPATDSPGVLSSSAQRRNIPNAAPSQWDRALLALPSTQNRLCPAQRDHHIYEFEY